MTNVRSLADLRNTIPTIVRGFLIAFLAIVSLGLYFIGLVEPLTPSEGKPTLGSLMIFAAIPRERRKRPPVTRRSACGL